MLPPVSAAITSHNDAGKAIFSASSGPIEGTLVNKGMLQSNMIYSINDFPPLLDDEKDIKDHLEFMRTKKDGIVNPGGTLFGIFDFAPGFDAPLHRTESVDYCVILEGEVELTLDSGKCRLLRKGDAAVQRATSHAWRNTSKTEWLRLAIVTQEARASCSRWEVFGTLHGRGRESAWSLVPILSEYMLVTETTAANCLVLC